MVSHCALAVCRPQSATFFPSLFQTFEFAEDIGATNVLQALYTIVRCLFFLNDSAILEQIIGDNLLATIGILECARAHCRRGRPRGRGPFSFFPRPGWPLSFACD